MTGLAISIRAMPPSEILGKNGVSCTFAGTILSIGVMATFRRNWATRQPPLSGRVDPPVGNRPSQWHAQIVVDPKQRPAACDTVGRAVGSSVFLLPRLSLCCDNNNTLYLYSTPGKNFWTTNLDHFRFPTKVFRRIRTYVNCGQISTALLNHFFCGSRGRTKVGRPRPWVRRPSRTPNLECGNLLALSFCRSKSGPNRTNRGTQVPILAVEA